MCLLKEDSHPYGVLLLRDFSVNSSVEAKVIPFGAHEQGQGNTHFSSIPSISSVTREQTSQKLLLDYV